MTDLSRNLGDGLKQKFIDNGDGTHSTGMRLQGGVGALTAVPAGSTNGSPLGTKPEGATGVRLYFPSSTDSVTFTVAAAQPAGAPSAVLTVSGADGKAWDELLAGTAMIYVTAKAGAPLFRWY